MKMLNQPITADFWAQQFRFDLLRGAAVSSSTSRSNIRIRAAARILQMVCELVRQKIFNRTLISSRLMHNQSLLRLVPQARDTAALRTAAMFQFRAWTRIPNQPIAGILERSSSDSIFTGRGCVVLDQPQQYSNQSCSRILQMVC